MRLDIQQYLTMEIVEKIAVPTLTAVAGSVAGYVGRMIQEWARKIHFHASDWKLQYTISTRSQTQHIDVATTADDPRIRPDREARFTSGPWYRRRILARDQEPGHGEAKGTHHYHEG